MNSVAGNLISDLTIARYSTMNLMNIDVNFGLLNRLKPYLGNGFIAKSTNENFAHTGVCA